MNTTFLRWFTGLAISLVILHLALVLIWGRGNVRFMLPWYAVVMDSVPILAALAVAVLAFGRYRVSREPMPFWLGVAFTAFALFALFDSLTAPSILPNGHGILGHLPGTSSWFWHLMLSTLGIFLICAILVPWPRAGAVGERWWFRLVVAGGLISIVLCWLLVAFEQFLPLLLINGAWTPLNTDWDYAILFVFAVGSLLSAHRYRQTGDLPFAYMAICQLILTFSMVTDLIGTRLYDDWWYWRRVLFVGAFSVMLFGLLSEYVRLYWRERDRTAELAALRYVTEVLVHEVELPRVAEVIIDQSFRVLHVDAAEIWLADPVRHELTLLGTRGYSSAFVQASRRLSFDAPHLAAIVARTERLQSIEDVRTSTVGQLDRQAYLREGVRSLLDVPLCARDHLVGVVCYATRRPHHFTAANLAFITSAAGLFAVTIENSRLYDEVRQALRLREEFMAAAAHELRSPVTVIQGRAQLTLKTDAQEKEARLALERILQASKRIGRLIEDLVAVLQVRPGFMALHRERLDLSALTRAVVEQTAQTTEHYDFQVTTEGPLPIDSDRALISEVLNRLLENAMRYAPEGGRIQVDARRMGSDAVVAVSGDGLGIPLERQPFVFEPFYELIPGGRPGYTGLVSLGLYLSKQIVEGHGGRIWFVSSPASGATFNFSLPLAPGAAS